MVLIGAKRRKVSPKATGRDACTFLSGVKEKYQKKHAKKGFANREGYALIYLDIARLFFFPKRTIRLYFNSRSALKEGGVRTLRVDV